MNRYTTNISKEPPSGIASTERGFKTKLSKEQPSNIEDALYGFVPDEGVLTAGPDIGPRVSESIAATAHALVHGKDVPDADVLAMAKELAEDMQCEVDAQLATGRYDIAGVQTYWDMACTAMLTIFGVDPATLLPKEKMVDELAMLRRENEQLKRMLRVERLAQTDVKD